MAKNDWGPLGPPSFMRGRTSRVASTPTKPKKSLGLSPEDIDAAQMAIRMARAVASEKHDKAERYGDDAPGAADAGNKIDRGCGILERLLAKAQPAKKGGGHG